MHAVKYQVCCVFRVHGNFSSYGNWWDCITYEQDELGRRRSGNEEGVDLCGVWDHHVWELQVSSSGLIGAVGGMCTRVPFFSFSVINVLGLGIGLV